jgi:hypothetical protein
MSRTRRFAVALSALAALTAIGSAGYVVLEGLPLTDCLPDRHDAHDGRLRGG